MIIKVCGMREPDNIRAIEQAGADMVGLIFVPSSKRYVQGVSSRCGTLPDHAGFEEGKEIGEKIEERRALRVGVFMDEMPQTIIARIMAYGLDAVQLHGTESPTMLDNLRATLIDIAPRVRLIKAIAIATSDDIVKAEAYHGHADLLLFDTKTAGEKGKGEKEEGNLETSASSSGGTGEKFPWHLLDAYHGPTPFLLSGGIGPDDLPRLQAFHHPHCAGIDINSRFETAPALKDPERVGEFIKKIRQLGELRGLRKI